MKEESSKVSEREYWIKNLVESDKSIKLKRDYYDDTSYERNHYSIVVNEDSCIQLKEICKNNDFNIYCFLVSVLKVVLSRYMLENNITVGIPYFNPNNIRKNINCKVLPLTSYVDNEITFKQYMMDVKKQIQEMYRLQDFLKIGVVSEITGSTDTMELTSVNICMKGFHNKEIIEYTCNSKNNELTFLLELVEDNTIIIESIYNSSLFSKISINSIAKSFIRALDFQINNYTKKMKFTEILKEEEKNQILCEFNNTKVEYDKNKTVINLFEEEAAKNPDSIAVIHGNQKLTYKQLNDKANRLAQKLRKAGIREESIVAIISEPDPNYIVSIVGVLKSGAAYLPILPEYPVERIEYMIRDSGATVILNLSGIELEECATLLDFYEEDYVTSKSIENINYSKSNNAAYVIYTSGSTGQPKGVLVEHKSLNNIVMCFIDDYGFGNMKAQMLYAQIVFDVSVLHIFTPLCKGNTLYLMTDILRTDYKELYRYVQKNNIGFIDLVPAQMEAMLDFIDKDCSNIRFILGGEVFPVSLYQKLISRINLEGIYNAYGPTETTVTALLHECKESESGRVIPVGKPIRNCRVYILDKHNMIQPIGVPGELCISGDGLARGYLNQQQLTEEKFVENPYEPGNKMYKTGDLTRWLADGSIEFCGRIDQQVKIRGYRIELGEIENVLAKQPGVKEVVVETREDERGAKYLCAYLVTNEEIQVNELRQHLSENLPDYMIPTYFIRLEKFALTPNGKIDRKKLPAPEGGTGAEYVAPRNAVEETLASIWSEVLGEEKVGIYDNFFELGGHSLKGTVLISRIHKELNIKVPLNELFRTP
ncbi:MAG: non-ribosomal peptide synthetase, partial [Bacillota bacterium]